MAESDQGNTGGQPSAPAAAPQRRPFIPREERERRRREALDKLQVGEWREGRVTSVVPFGAFVDLGGIDGLVHISQLGTGGYVEKAEDVVQVGQTVRVRVVEIDRDRQRIGLSMREPSAPRAPRPQPSERPAGSGAGGGFAPAEPAGGFPDSAPAHAGPRRSDRGGSGGSRNRDQFRENRPRNRRRDEATDEDWRPARGGAARDYYAVFDDDTEDEPAPTTAEELVARFNRGKR